MIKRKQFLVFGSPLIEEEEIEEVVATLRSGWIGTGPRVQRLEEMMAAYTGARYAVALNSCTAALHLSLLVLGIGKDDEVITTPLTFASTANAILHTGAKPVFVDVDPATMLIDPKRIEEAITPRTKAILPVHLAGRPCAMDEIGALAGQHGLRVVSDAAHAIETTYHGSSAANLGDLACFSFYVNKNVTTAEGGMAITKNAEWANRIRILSLHGMDRDAYRRFSESGYRHYEVVEPGFKYNMTDLQAALGIHQLNRIAANWQRRDHIWKRYQSCLSDLPIGLPNADEPGTRHARHLFTILIHEEKAGKTRDEVIEELRELNIGCGVHYTPVHLHPYYRKTFGYAEGDFPHSESIGKSTLSLPFSAKLTDQDVDDVIAALHHIFSA